MQQQLTQPLQQHIQQPILNKFKQQFYSKYCNIMNNLTIDNFELYFIDIIGVLLSSYDIIVNYLDKYDYYYYAPPLQTKFMVNNNAEYKISMNLKKVVMVDGYCKQYLNSVKLNIYDIKNIINIIARCHTDRISLTQCNNEYISDNCYCSALWLCGCCCCAPCLDPDRECVLCVLHPQRPTIDRKFTTITVKSSTTPNKTSWESDNHLIDSCDHIDVSFTFKKSNIDIEQIKILMQNTYITSGTVGPCKNDAIAVPFIQVQNSESVVAATAPMMPVYK